DEQRDAGQSYSMRLLLRFKIKVLRITQVHRGSAYRLPIASCAYHSKRPIDMHRANLLEGESAFRAIPVRNASAHFNKRHRPQFDILDLKNSCVIPLGKDRAPNCLVTITQFKRSLECLAAQ